MDGIEDFGISFDKVNMRINYWCRIRDKVFSNFKQIKKEDIDTLYIALTEVCNRFGEEIKDEEKTKRQGKMMSYLSMVHYINREFI